jgi:protein TorT
MYKTILKLGAASVALALANPASAADWWPFAIDSAVDGNLENVERIEYAPTDKASKPYSLCVLLPHLQDSYWVSVNYGLVEEARRLGVKMVVYQAGGYSNLPNQLSQYDDCLAGGADAILIGAISEAGVAAKINEGMAKGVVNIAVANPVLETPITARITPDFYQKGMQTGNYVKEYLGDNGGKAVGFPSGRGFAPDISRADRHLGRRPGRRSRSQRKRGRRTRRRDDHLVLRKSDNARSCHQGRRAGLRG